VNQAWLPIQPPTAVLSKERALGSYQLGFYPKSCREQVNYSILSGMALPSACELVFPSCQVSTAI